MKKNAKLIRVKLSVPKLIPGAFPTLLPNCPAYLSSSGTRRESPNERRERKDVEQLTKAIQQSEEDYDNTGQQNLSF